MTAKERKKREKFVVEFGFLLCLFILLILRFTLLAELLIGLVIILYLGRFFKYFISKMRIASLLTHVKSEPNVENYKKIIAAYVSIYDFTNASIYGDKALKQYPDDSELLTWRAIVYRRLDEDEKAVALMIKALEIEPFNQFVRNEAISLESMGFTVLPP